jgi:hypothetical protein
MRATAIAQKNNPLAFSNLKAHPQHTRYRRNIAAIQAWAIRVGVEVCGSRHG